MSESDEDEPAVPHLPWGVQKEVQCPAPAESRDRPQIGDEVAIHFGSRLQDGTVIGSTNEEPFRFVLGKQPREHIEGLELGVMTMKKGEAARLTIAPRYAYDDLGCPPLVPPDATLVFDIELVDWEPSWSTPEDLFCDGRVVKTTLERGTGTATAKKGQEVKLSVKTDNYQDKPMEAHSFECIDHVIGDSDFGILSRIMAEALTHMVEGERANVKLRRFTTSDTIVDKSVAGATLNIILLRIYEVTDISLAGDQSLVKKVLVKGQGCCPAYGQLVRLRVDSAIDGGQHIPGFRGPGILEFHAGDGEVSDAFELVVLSMAAGERVDLRCRHPSSYCRKGELGLVFSSSRPAILTVDLLSVEEASDAAAPPQEQQFQLILAHKNKGAELFKQRRFVLALKRYDHVLHLLSLADSQDAQARGTLRVTCELNRAACFLQVGKPTEAIVACDRVLACDPNQIKALYRRSSAYFELSDYAKALHDVTTVVRLDPKNGDARALLLKIRDSRKQYSREAKTTAAQMLGCRGSSACAVGGADAAAAGIPAQVRPARVAKAGTGICACIPYICTQRV